MISNFKHVTKNISRAKLHFDFLKRTRSFSSEPYFNPLTPLRVKLALETAKSSYYNYNYANLKVFFFACYLSLNFKLYQKVASMAPEDVEHNNTIITHLFDPIHDRNFYMVIMI